MADTLQSEVITPDAQTGEVALDPGLGPVPPPRPLPWHARFGLSWSTGAIPVVLMLLLGAALGPAGIAVLTPTVLGVIDPIIPVAVAALGILAGLEFTRPAAPKRWELLGKASLESLLTGVVVAVGIWLILPVSPNFQASDMWMVAVVAGLCASMSASLPEVDPHRLRSAATRMRDLDVLLPAIIGALVLASFQSLSPLASLGLALQAAILALLISATAWLLLTDTSPTTEQRVFSVAALLLVGGIADYLSLSALAGGLLAGLFWGRVGGVARDCIERDVGYLRHPLVVLMLITAGAKTVVTSWVLLLAIAYLLLRIVAKLAGGWLVRRVPGLALRTGVGVSLLPPGVFGIAFALDAGAMMESSAAAVLSATVLGSIGSQLIAAMWHSPETHE